MTHKAVVMGVLCLFFTLFTIPCFIGYALADKDKGGFKLLGAVCFFGILGLMPSLMVAKHYYPFYAKCEQGVVERIVTLACSRFGCYTSVKLVDGHVITVKGTYSEGGAVSYNCVTLDKRKQ